MGRQGDPLSPFLFTLVADVFSRMLSRGLREALLTVLGLGGRRDFYLAIANTPMILFSSPLTVWMVSEISSPSSHCSSLSQDS